MLIRSPAIWCAFTIGALTCPAGLLEAHQAGFSVPIFRALREGKGWSLSYLVPTCFPSYAATVSRLNAQTLPPNRYGVAFFAYCALGVIFFIRVLLRWLHWLPCMDYPFSSLYMRSPAMRGAYQHGNFPAFRGSEVCARRGFPYRFQV